MTTGVTSARTGAVAGAGDVGAAAALSAAEVLRRLETRLDRVERTVGATVDLLHNLLHPDRAKPGSGTER